MVKVTRYQWFFGSIGLALVGLMTYNIIIWSQLEAPQASALAAWLREFALSPVGGVITGIVFWCGIIGLVLGGFSSLLAACVCIWIMLNPRKHDEVR